MSHGAFLFFLNTLFCTLAMGCLVGRDWIVGGMFACAYCFTYWLATKPESPDEDEPDGP